MIRKSTYDLVKRAENWYRISMVTRERELWKN
jgi:hypothetical protein